MTDGRAFPGSRDSIEAAAVPSNGRSLFESRFVVYGLAIFIGLVLGWRNAVAVWKTNRFYDTDDAMHLVQMRDWLAGQGWFDMIERRLDPPGGTLMHWSRIVDVPLAAFVRLFGLFASSDMAERMTRIAYPLVLQIALYLAVSWAARKLVGFRGAALAVILAACSLSVLVQFPPGRINHHNLQILLMVLMVGASLDAFGAKPARGACLAAVCAALSLSITLENLPFIGVMIAVYALAWVFRAERFAEALAWFAGSFGVAIAVAFVAIRPPHLYTARVCDAFSAAHLVPGDVGCAALLVLAFFGTKLRHWGLRALACVFAGGVTIAVLFAVAPQCVGDPYGAVDPLVRSVWLSHVTEGRPLLSLFHTDPARALTVALPLLAACVAAIIAAVAAEGEQRVGRLLVAAMLATGLAGAFWQIILGTYAAVLTGLGAAWCFERILESKFSSAAGRIALAALLALVLAPEAWALIGLGISKSPTPSSACFESRAYAAFASLKPGVVLGPIDASPYILVFSRQSVVDGPYHRDNRGNRLAIEAMTSPPDVARKKIEESGANYVAICPSMDEALLYARIAPTGLAADLARSAVPAWLHEIKPRAPTPFRIFQVD